MVPKHNDKAIFLWNSRGIDDENIFFALICMLSAVLFCACGELNLFGEQEQPGNNYIIDEPSTDGHYCWEVLVDTGDEHYTTEYYWDTDAGIGLTVQGLNENYAGTKVFSVYQKLNKPDKQTCSDLNKSAKEE